MLLYFISFRCKLAVSDIRSHHLYVKSGHSIHRSPAAMRELLRILRLHLRELEEK